MIIFDENMEPVIFDTVLTPTHVEYFYTLNLDIIDVTLSPLLALEEIVSPAFLVEINGFSFYLPTSYHVLVYSDETSQVDTVKIHELTNTDFLVFGYDSITDKVVPIKLKIMDYVPEYKFTSPLLYKNQMLCHPISPNRWINITPFDQYKMITNKVIGDFMV